MPLILPGDLGAEGSRDEGQTPYEAPVLTPIGCLHDLLAGGGTKSCDNGMFQGTTGGPDPSNPASPTLC